MGSNPVPTSFILRVQTGLYWVQRVTQGWGTLAGCLSITHEIYEIVSNTKVTKQLKLLLVYYCTPLLARRSASRLGGQGVVHCFITDEV